MAGWELLSNLLKAEFIQRRYEGCDVSGFDVLIDLAILSGDETSLEKNYNELVGPSVQLDFPFDEPSDLDGIRFRRQCRPLHLSGSPTPDQFLVAWI